MRHFETDIDRYLAQGLAPEAEANLRSHLRTCEHCRSYYDQQVVLLRALSGDPESPTPQEQDRLVHLALESAGLAEPHESRQEEPGLLDRLRWIRAPALAGAALLAILIAASLWYFLAEDNREPAARLTKAVSVSVDDVQVDLETEAPALVLEGQTLEVGQDGIAELSLERGGTVRVYPGAILILHGPGSRLDLGRGKVWCLIDHTKVPFMVKTDLAETRVVGTSFVVERTPGATNIRVIEGQVEVTSLEREQKVRLGEGWKTRVASGEPPSPPNRYRPARDRSEWDRKVDELWHDIRRSLRKIRKYFEGR